MATYHSDGESITIPAGTARTAGTLAEYGGKAGIFNETYLATEPAALRIKGVITLENPDSVVIADGAAVGYDIAGNKAIATTTGDFDCGTCVGASSGANDIYVLLNGDD